MDASVKRILRKLCKRFKVVYGDQLAHMVLFGSRARGDAEPDSDIDVLVVLHGSVNPDIFYERKSQRRFFNQWDAVIASLNGTGREVTAGIFPYSSLQLENT